MNAAALTLQRGGGPAVHHAARGVRGAIRPVRAKGEDQDIVQSSDPLRRRKRKLLIASALSLAGEVNDRLAASKEGKILPLLRVRARDGGEE